VLNNVIAQELKRRRRQKTIPMEKLVKFICGSKNCNKVVYLISYALGGHNHTT